MVDFLNGVLTNMKFLLVGAFMVIWLGVSLAITVGTGFGMIVPYGVWTIPGIIIGLFSSATWGEIMKRIA